MATDPGTVDFLLDQLGRRDASYSTKRMFGEYCLYRDGNPVAFVCDDVLFIKDTLAGRAVLTAAGLLDFGPPYPGAKDYLRLPPDGWDDGEWLRRLLDATASELPAPKIRKAPSAKEAATVTKPAKKKPSGPARKSSVTAKKSPSPSATAKSTVQPKKSTAKKIATKRVAASKPSATTSQARAITKRATKR